MSPPSPVPSACLVRVDMQYTRGPLVWCVHGLVAGVTRSTTAKAEEEAEIKTLIYLERIHYLNISFAKPFYFLFASGNKRRL